MKILLAFSNFKIYSASAGSGKTYTLTKAYLKLLLGNDSPTKFRQILAITFTNKAVAEMKTRILESLYSFSIADNGLKPISLFVEICEELSLSAEQLQKKSKLVLKRILHNYSFFEISTIDKFNHKIIKTFARDLQLSQNFEVELDTESLLEEAVGQLLERAGNDKELTEVLIAFSLEKIDDDKSWDIAYDLLEIGKLLFQENHSTHLEKLRSKSLTDFNTIKKNIASQIKSIEKGVVEGAKKLLQEIDRLGFAPSDFPRQTLPNHFKKIVGGEFNTKNLYNNKLEQNLIDNKVLKATDKRETIHLAALVLEGFLSIKQGLYRRGYLKNIYGNIVPLTVLNEIAKELKNIQDERDIIPISSMNNLLSNEIRNQPVPFIYERMGEKYRHFFIDEFQDTSKMQWDNLVPLISNALESENDKKEQGSLFLVGDVKQAIYRWRGGRAEQFLNLLTNKSYPFVVEPEIRTLDKNWRSHDEIVNFNNEFFTLIAPILKRDAYTKLFLEDCNQKTNNKPGGYVQLSFLEKNLENKEEVYCNEVLKAIGKVTSKNHPYADICVLVRDNKKGMLLADFLSGNNIPIISSDALLLANNEKIIFLISLLKVIENENDKEAAYQVLTYLAVINHETHEFISTNIARLEKLFSENYGFNIQNLRSVSVFNILESAIIQFDLSEDTSAYLAFLMDEVLVVERRDGPDIHSFLKYWERKKESLSIAAPDGINAVKIMTVHKAKGLEFPIVIFPFANSIIDDKRKKKKSWVAATEAEENLGLDEFLLNVNRELLDYNELTAQAYINESKKTELDSINVLYVALTRAEKGLFIISEEGKDIPSINNALSYSDLFRYYLHESGQRPNNEGAFAFGALSSNTNVDVQSAEIQNHINYITRGKEDVGFAISTKSSQLWDDEKRDAIEMGNLIHLALSHIKTVDDVRNVMEDLKLSGDIPVDSATHIEQKIFDVINHPELCEYFSSDYEIRNEQEILTTGGESLRPDRIAIKGTQVTVIDYKTGKPSPSHKHQIARYAQILKVMDFEIKYTIIVYIDQKINPIFP